MYKRRTLQRRIRKLAFVSHGVKEKDIGEEYSIQKHKKDFLCHISKEEEISCDKKQKFPTKEDLGKGLILSHVERHSCILRCVLLLSSHIWKHNCTSGNISHLGHLAKNLYACFLLRVSFTFPKAQIKYLEVSWMTCDISLSSNMKRSSHHLRKFSRVFMAQSMVTFTKEEHYNEE